jgi:cell division protein FtsI/penicillin-binding protein 2
MQMHLAMAAIANGGEWVAPRLLREVRFSDGTVLPLGSERSRKVLSADTADELKRMLARVVETGGTATGAAIDGYQVAGKTGTARKLVDGRYSRQHHFASFSGFFPAKDPRVVITVMVDDPTAGRSSYGGAVAGPTFRTIGERLIPHLGIRKPEHWDTLYVSKE